MAFKNSASFEASEEFHFKDEEMMARERPRKGQTVAWKSVLILISILGNIYLLWPSASREEYIPIDYGTAANS
jgi:hypothetical protein